jgi:hypothetical protein
VAANKQVAPAEVKWAEGIVTDFWKAMSDGSTGMAAGLLSPELSDGLRRGTDSAGEYLQLLRAWDSVSVERMSHEVAPGGGEIIFKGVNSGKVTYPEDYKRDFTLRVAKENGGRWSIRFIAIEWRDVTGAKKKSPTR